MENSIPPRFRSDRKEDDFMNVSVELENGLLPDRFGKHAPDCFQKKGHPIRSFPLTLDHVPDNAQSLALTFVDWDAIPVGGFCWIHWIACNFPASTLLIPENASATEAVPCVQGSNSSWSPLAGSYTDPSIIHRYTGPCPPDRTHVYTLTVYALDCTLDLAEGYYLNEFRHAAKSHVLAKASREIPSRS